MRDFGALNEAGVLVRDDRVQDVFEIGAGPERQILRLGGVVGVHLVDARRRLRRDVSLRARREIDFDEVAVALQDAAGIGDDADAGKRRHLLVPVERLLNDQRRPAVHASPVPCDPARGSKPRRTMPTLPNEPLRSCLGSSW